MIPSSMQAKTLQASVEWRGGNALLSINDQMLLPHFFYGGYKLRRVADAPHSRFADQIPLAWDAGVRILSSEVQTPWERNGRIDFTAVDRIIQTMIDTSPDAYIHLRFSIDSPPWWNEAHPEECTIYADGQRGEGAMASPAWREEMLRNISRLVDHCEEKYGDRIAMYQVCGLEYGEWIYPGVWERKTRGYDEHTRRAFMEWALKRYGSWERLRDEWALPDLAPETFRGPSEEERLGGMLGDFRDPGKERRGIDYRIFENDLVADTLLLAAETVKQKTAGRKGVGAFYGYLFEIAALPGGPAASGHLALQRVLESPHVDMLASPISYGDRSHDGIGAFMAPVDSVAAHGKLWMVEDDSRTWLCLDDSWPAVYGKVDTLEKSIWVHRRNWGHIVPRRAGLWHMDLIDDGWFDSPELWDNIRDLRRIYEQNLEEPKTFAPEIAVFVDPASMFYLTDGNKISGPLFSVFRSQLYRIGAPVGFYLLSDLIEGRVPAAKVNLFLGAWNVSERCRTALHNTLNGTTAVWFHGSGRMRGASAGTEWMNHLTGFDFREEQGSATIRLSTGLASKGQREFKTLQWHTDHARRTTQAVEREVTLNPRWSVRGRPGIETLAVYTDNGQAAVARARHRGFESIYAGTLGLPADALRAISRAAGVHIYLDSDDVVSADERFLAVSATTAGVKDISLPLGEALTDLMTGNRYGTDADRPIRIRFKEGETRLFKREPIEGSKPGPMK